MGSGNEIKDEIYRIGEHNFFKEILYVFNNRQDMINKEGEIVNAKFVLREDTYNKVRGGTSANKNLCTNLIEKSEDLNEYNHFKDYDIDKLQSIMNYISTIINDKNIIENKKKYKKVSFSKIAKEYYDINLASNLIETDKLEAKNKMQELLEMSDEFSEYLKYVSIETMKIYSFREAKIKELYDVQKLKDIIKDYGIIPGQTISRDEILDKLIKAYSDNNITYIKPKATILKDWFFIEELTINKNKFYHIIDFK
jgi:hypothetical protein